MEQKVQLNFQINPSSGEPIYKQLIEQINRLILSGFLKAGDGLPSVRQAASSLEVNPMTISKAYSLLESNGLLERRRGRGMVVAENHTKPQTIAKRLEKISPILEEAAAQARQLNIPKNEIFQKVLKIYLRASMKSRC